MCTATGGVPHTYGCSAAAPSAASYRCTRRAVWLALAPVGWDAQSVIAPIERRPIVHVVHSLTASAADEVSTTDYRTPGAEFSAAFGCLEASRRRHTAARWIEDAAIGGVTYSPRALIRSSVNPVAEFGGLLIIEGVSIARTQRFGRPGWRRNATRAIGTPAD